jgi:hypothetical protein
MHKDYMLAFCVLCFADEESGSWDHIVVKVGAGTTHCTNCGAGGSTVTIPKWAVDNIRQNSSWVGKRYYPNEEDKDAQVERQALLKLVPSFPGRSAVFKPEYSNWWVTQVENGRSVSTFAYAETAEEACRAATNLRYVPEE